MTVLATVAGTQLSRNSEERVALRAASTSPVASGRSTSEPAEKTGAPSVSTAVTETDSGPVRVSRTRSTDAPAACSRTCDQANGTRPPSTSSSPASGQGCSAASSRAGCTP
ncbi:hypothetical protein Kisp01_22360 [Kineosporia sp. NBRC 101677]|nr:hypothetical protein Kisp01_22360 [Kineosporia sp. NBRC 101677]